MKRDNASILVVDDDPALLSSFQEVLEAEGYEVTAAADGESGLRCLQEQAFDLVLSDLALPGLDGMELLKYLQREAPLNVATKQIPRVRLADAFPMGNGQAGARAHRRGILEKRRLPEIQARLRQPAV